MLEEFRGLITTGVLHVSKGLIFTPKCGTRHYAWFPHFNNSTYKIININGEVSR